MASTFDSTASQQGSSTSVSSTKSATILKSDWTGLNPALIAKFYPLKRSSSGTGWQQSFDTRTISAADKFTVYDGYEVWAPATDGTSEITQNWHSPFEGAGAESKAPTLSSMLQSGSLSPTLQALAEKTGSGSTTDSVSSAVASAEGRVGITKLNSTQVFQGMPPVKISLTLHFRAIVDPISEVRDPISMLKQWAVPQYLASDGVIANAVQNGGNQPLVDTIFPSMAPQIIGMRYGDMTYQPMVIESISEPITNPRDSSGVSISCSIQIQLATLTAIDRRDIMSLYK